MRSITWFQTFLVSIFSDSTFPNTFFHFKNFYSTISSIFLWSATTSSSFLQSSLSSTIYFTIFSSSRATILFSFSFVFLLYNGRYLVIFTSPVSQFISGLCLQPQYLQYYICSFQVTYIHLHPFYIILVVHIHLYLMDNSSCTVVCPINIPDYYWFL